MVEPVERIEVSGYVPASLSPLMSSTMSESFRVSLLSLHTSNPGVNWPLVIADTDSMFTLLSANPDCTSSDS